MKKWKQTAGFTLVELIVVIAIIGILAGVGTVGYSGYIKKANEASDNMLLSTVNRAFAAACVEGGDQRPANAEAKLTDENKIEFVKSDVDTEGTVFDKYYEGNEDSAFKFYTNLGYDRSLGQFTAAAVTYKENADGTRTYTFKTADGKTLEYTIDSDSKDAFNDSAFGTNMTMPDLLGRVDYMSNAVGSVVNNVTASGATYKILKNVYGDNVDSILGLTKDDAGNYDSVQLGNALVLAVAKRTTGFSETTTQLLNNLQNVLGNDTQRNNVALAAAAGDATQISNMALAYAMMTSFVNSDASVGQTVTVNGETKNLGTYFNDQVASLRSTGSGSEAAGIIMTTAAEMAKSDAFNAYLSGAQGQKDMDGYRAAMSSIAANEETLLSGNDVVNAGVDNSEIALILNAIFAGT